MDTDFIILILNSALKSTILGLSVYKYKIGKVSKQPNASVV